MAAPATARTSAPARRAPARRAATPPRKPVARKATARRAPTTSRRRRSGHTPIGGFVPVAAAAGAVGGLADSGLFVWLTRGRLWIGLLGGLLVGIVGLNVMALSFSASESNAGQAADALRRENSSLRAEIAGKLSNSEIQDAAAKLGLVMPAAGSFRYLTSSPDDAKQAAQRLRDGELTAAAVTAPADLVAVTPAPVDVAPVEIAPAVADPAASTDAPVVAAPDPAVVDPAVAPAPADTATATGGAVGAP